MATGNVTDGELAAIRNVQNAAALFLAYREEAAQAAEDTPPSPPEPARPLLGDSVQNLMQLISAAVSTGNFSSEDVTAISALHGAVDCYLDRYEDHTPSAPRRPHFLDPQECAWCTSRLQHDDEHHPVACPICGDRMCSNDCLQDHMECEHPDQEICPQCHMTFFLTSPLVSYCDTCGYRFCSPSCRDEHLRRVHNLPPPPAEIRQIQDTAAAGPHFDEVEDM